MRHAAPRSLDAGWTPVGRRLDVGRGLVDTAHERMVAAMRTLSLDGDRCRSAYDAVVVGSGYGGGVTACRLARRRLVGVRARIEPSAAAAAFAEFPEATTTHSSVRSHNHQGNLIPYAGPGCQAMRCRACGCGVLTRLGLALDDGLRGRSLR